MNREYRLALRDAARRLEPHRAEAVPADVVAWVRKHNGFLWSKQKEIIAALNEYRANVAVYTSNGVGKTWLCTTLAMHFALRHRRENAVVVIVAASWDQVHQGTFREWKDPENQERMLPGVLRDGQKVFNVDGRTMVYWRAPGDTGRNVIQGIHAEKMLVILEEANELTHRTWVQAVDAITSGGDARILAIGNPTDTGTAFHGACQPGSGWKVIQIGAKDTPNFTGEWIPNKLKDALPNKAWFQEKKRTMSRAEFRSRVLGLFPERSEYSLIDPAWITAAMQEKEHPENAEVKVCIDPGSGGDPTCALIMREGADYGTVEFIEMGIYEYSRDRESAAGHICRYAKEAGASSIIVDSFGVGADYGPILAAGMPEGTVIVMLNTGDRQKLKKRLRRKYKNPRALLAWRLAERMRTGTLFLPRNDSLEKQMAELRQLPPAANDGLFTAEPKDEMKERINRSPDELDALMLSMWHVQAWTEVAMGGK